MLLLPPVPEAEGFRIYFKTKLKVSAEEILIDKAQLLTLTTPEMTALIAGHVLNTHFDESKHRVFAKARISY